jgi:hypothetical protein
MKILVRVALATPIILPPRHYQFIYAFLHLLVVLFLSTHWTQTRFVRCIENLLVAAITQDFSLHAAILCHSPIPRKPNSATTNHPPVFADRGGTAPGIEPAFKDVTCERSSNAGIHRRDLQHGEGTVWGGLPRNHG